MNDDEVVGFLCASYSISFRGSSSYAASNGIIGFQLGLLGVLESLFVFSCPALVNRVESIEFPNSLDSWHQTKLLGRKIEFSL